MNVQNRACANNPAYPAGALDRLALFAEWTNTTPPEQITEGQGEDLTFSTPFLIYARDQGLSLDWVWLGDERGLVMAYHRNRQGEQA